MKELSDIIEEWKQSKQKKEKAVLATLVKVDGSTYRRPGARMLMTEGNKRIGALSAGCLEDDVWQRSQKVFADGKSEIIRYDTTSDQDIVMGLGLGCRGQIEILLERIEDDSYFSFIENCIRTGKNGALTSVFRVEGDIAARVGDRVMVDQLHTAGDSNEFLAKVAADARSLLQKGRSQLKQYKSENGQAEVLLELLEPMSLVIFGAGPDAAPLVEIARQIGWRITLVDARPAYADPEKFPEAEQVILSRPQNIAQHLNIDTSDVLLVMTHNYLQDVDWLAFALKSPARYVGQLGPRRRTDELLTDITKQNIEITPEERTRLHSPVGLDIGGDTPMEIAIAIIAEIQAFVHGKNGKPLREKQGAIHDD